MKKKVLIIISVIVLLLVLIIGVYFIFFHKPEAKNEDALKFKEEYESLNNTVRKSDGANYNNVDVPEDNPIKYISVDEAIDLLDSKKTIIYVGANWCPWCRNMLKPMFDVAEELEVDTIYYLELDDDKSNYEVKDGELKKVNNGSDSYYKLLDELKDYLEDYELTDDEGNTYSTGEKRIYIPFFITIKNGGIVEAKGISRTLEEGQDKYSEMTDKQYDALYEEFYNTFSKVYPSDSSCPIDDECN